MEQAFSIVLIGCIVLAFDTYLIKGLRIALQKWKFSRTKYFAIIYWSLSVFITGGLFVSMFARTGLAIRSAYLLVFFLFVSVKAIFLLFMLADDLRRWIKRRKQQPVPVETDETIPLAPPINRSEFLMKAGLLVAAAPIGGMVYGMVSGVYHYRVKRQTLYLPNLPKAFDGIKLGQISDIHSGSFYNKKAVEGGIDLLLREKPDVIFFTGDLVNDFAREMLDYQDIFSKVKAPLGVYSSLGNHDYGDYFEQPDAWWVKKNFNDLIDTHKNMGWDLIRNDHRRIKVGGEEIGILGVENWGALNRYPNRGRIDLAMKNTDDLPVKLLLSHDPSHWRAEVLKHPQIDVMFSGHTHGMQFGVRTKGFQWSPIRYIYKEWAGLYREGHQQLYVNVGYGFLGYPGRLGILPEITIFELKASADPSLQKQA
ncbi:MAG: metallophosphoesterase [Bacteroidetes bacterium]|nr:metallophosphoesterase [Bacteroidota bacterium]